MEYTENPFFSPPKAMVVEGNLSFHNRYSRPQKQRGKSPPRTGDTNAFHSSGQTSNNLDWEKDELNISSNWRRKVGGGYGGDVLPDVVRFSPRNGKTVVIASS